MSLLSGIRTLDDLDLENKKVLLRTDLDAPLGKSGALLAQERIAAALPTISKLRKAGATVIVASRFGELRKEQSDPSKAPSIEPAAAKLSELCGADVLLPDSCAGDAVKKVLSSLRAGQICVLENLARENDRGPEHEAFARKLIRFVDAYVADSVRALAVESATTTVLPRLVDDRAAGITMMKELQALSRIRAEVDPPRILIWGGNSLSGRLELMETLAQSAEKIFLVGVAANTMLLARGHALGKTAVETEYLAGARTLHERWGHKMVLPVDLAVAESTKATASEIRPVSDVGRAQMALDLGPESLELIAASVARANTVIWCGNAGFYRSQPFAQGTRKLCETLAASSAFTLVTGDDSVAAVHAIAPELAPQIDCVAGGGNAALSILNNNKLCGLEALRGQIDD